MTDSPPNAESLPCRFLFGSGPADAVCRQWLAADMCAAQLSWKFRAYYRLRSVIPLPVRQALQRYRQVEHDEAWYLPTAFTQALRQAVAEQGGVTAIHPWPNDAAFAFVPTHDVETSDGMRRIPLIADMEESIGFRSSWNLVPHKYPIDAGLVRDLQARGFEIGVHGYNHDGKLFTSRRVFDKRTPAIGNALRQYDAVGFRAPMVHRNLGWMQSLDIDYDASCFDVDPYQAMPGGVGSVWPFIAGRFVELPYTLPQDHTLFIALGERDGRIWEEKLDYVAQLGGAALFITHPDYLDSDNRREAYRQLLLKARAMAGMWHALPREVAAWWRERDALQLSIRDDGSYHIAGPAAEKARVATLTATTSTAPRSRGLEWQSTAALSRRDSQQLVVHN